MRRLLAIALAAVLMSACEQMSPDVNPEPVKQAVASKGRKITVNTEEVRTKTAIMPKQGGGYSFTWQENDDIRLFELVYENYGSSEADAQAGDYFDSERLPQDAPSASFNVDLYSALNAPSGAKYRYIASSPCYAFSLDYWTADEVAWNDYDAVWPESECTINHPILIAPFPYEQRPTSTSFDPQADLMVSMQKVLESRAEGAMLMSFARAGAIVKVRLSGLPAGEKVETGYIQFGDSFKVHTKVEYDPVLGDVRFVPQDIVPVGKETYESDYRFGFYSNTTVEINPTDVYVDDSGNVDLWLRLPAGKVTDSFFVKVWTRAYQLDKYQYPEPGEWHSFGKSVDLAAQNKSLSFENGRMTSFSVAADNMPDPYLRLSGSYTDAYGGNHNVVTENGYINIGEYGAYLSATGGTVVLDVETNADPSDISFNSYYSWVETSFNPETMKLTITYQPCPEYTNYMVSSRDCTIYAELASFAGANVQIGVNQLKPYFADSGTRKSILTWHGGSVTGIIRCNTAPVIECPDDVEHQLSWDAVKTDTGYQVTFTLTPNDTDGLSVLPVYVKDAVSPDSRDVTINLLRYPMIADGSYYILTQNTHNGTPYHWYGVGADLFSENLNAFTCDIAFDTQGDLDFDNTDYLKAFTFTRIEDSEDYRITCKRGERIYYLSYGTQRQGTQYYLTLNPDAPLTAGNGKDASRWDVVSLGSEIAILNHVYEDEAGGIPPHLVHYNLDGPAVSVYLRRASFIEITDNQGSFGTTYFCKAKTWAESWNGQTELPCNVKLYDISNGTYLPMPY